MLLRCWHAVEWIESALAMVAVFAVGIGPPLLAFFGLIFAVLLGRPEASLGCLLVMAITGPAAVWVKERAEAALPLGPGFTLRVVAAVTTLAHPVRFVWSLLWTSQFLLCVGLGVAFHRALLDAPAKNFHEPLLLTLLVLYQVGMTLAANLYLLLAAAAVCNAAQFVAWISRQRFFIDLAVTAVMLLAAHQ